MKKKMILAAVCLLLISFVPQTVLAGEAQAIPAAGTEDQGSEKPVWEKVSCYRYAAKKMRLYNEADTSSKSISVKKSTQLKVTGVRSDGWSKVTYKKKTYYCRTDTLAKTNGYVVVIDAGHQKKANTAKERVAPGSKKKKMKVTGGAVGVSTHQTEYNLNLKVAKQLRTVLKQRGYKVVMIRTSNNVNISNSARAKKANKAKADVFIHIHANSINGRSKNGALTISPTKKNRYCKKIYKKSNALSKAVLKEFCKATKAKNLGILYDDNMTGINWSKVPVTTIEMGFLSNPKEDKKMATAAYQKKMVKGIANGIDAYLKR